MLDIKKVKDQALKEVTEEKEESAKIRIKKQLKEINDTEIVLKNMERELEDLYDELTQGN